MSHLPPGSLPNGTPDLSAVPSEVPDPQQTCVLGCPPKAPKNRRLRKSVAQTQLTGNKLNLGESEEPAHPAERFKSSMALKRVACMPDLLMLRARPESLSCSVVSSSPRGCVHSHRLAGVRCAGAERAGISWCGVPSCALRLPWSLPAHLPVNALGRLPLASICLCLCRPFVGASRGPRGCVGHAKGSVESCH